MMKNQITLLLLLLMGGMAISAAPIDIKSPDGHYVFTFTQRAGQMFYQLQWNGRQIIRESELGVDIQNQLFESALGIPNDTCTYWGSTLTVDSVTTSSHDGSWAPLYGENATIRDHYNEMVIHMSKGGAKNRKADYDFDKRQFYTINIIVRAYDEGVALRYHFPEQSNGLFLNIRGERTSFSLPEGTMAFHQGWAQGPFNYVPLKNWKNESERPLLLHEPDGTSVALLEAAMNDYARGKFRLVAPNQLQVSLYDGVELMSPYSTPWRVIMAGTDVDLVNHKDLILNLNAPSPYEHRALTSMKHTTPLPSGGEDGRDAGCFIKPGKAYRCGNLRRDYILKGIRFAEQQHLQYIELDARWYGPEMAMASSALAVSSERDFTIPEVVDSARAHGLGVWLYVNQRALYQQLDSILPLYERWGVSGIKFGFVQVGNQMWSTWLHQAVAKCAEHHLMVDIHDEYRPTGMSRTYPNLLTQEGVGGNEEMPDATHDVTLPFTRWLCGPADYTLSYYCNRIKNTRGHQLAMAAVYYSPLQFMFWYDDPKLFDGGEELAFWRAIPTVFDESRCLDGHAGKYIVQARRAGSDWFVGAMNSTEAQTITLNTATFLTKGKKYRVELYQDDPTLQTRSKVSTTVLTLKAGKTITLPLQPSGGAALRFVEL